MELLQRRRTWCEISLDNVRSNFKTIRKAAADSAKLCCVVKANAYGHGAATLARIYQEMGADFFAVSNIEEAIELRNADITKPILILGYTPVECADILAKLNISQSVFSSEYAKALSDSAEKAGVCVKIHIKTDTGMGRIGFVYRHPEDKDNYFAEVTGACSLPGLVPEGIFTHFADSADDPAYTDAQFECFLSACGGLAERGFKLIRHCSNSAAIFGDKKRHLDMVRAGIVLYGLAPSDILPSPELRPAMTMKSVVSLVKEIRPGDSVGYSMTFKADKPMKVATVAAGYADGYLRSSGSNGAYLTTGGKKCPLVGRVSMDQLAIAADCNMGDEVVLFGENGISADELAKLNGTIGYELVCAVSRRVPRVYISDGKTVGIHDDVIAYEN